MAQDKEGKRSATFEVQIVDGGNKIVMHLNAKGTDHSPITFDAKSGRSGPKAYGKLAEILRAETP
jgi:hypothetical protein